MRADPAGHLCSVDNACRGARSRGDQQHIAGTDGGRGHFADDVHIEAEMHEAHRDHLQRKAAASGTHDEYALGIQQHALRRGDFLVTDRGERALQFLEDKSLIRWITWLFDGAERHNFIKIAFCRGRIKQEIPMADRDSLLRS